MERFGAGFEDTREDGKTPEGGCPRCLKCRWHIIKGHCGCGDGMSDELKDLLWGKTKKDKSE